MENKIKKNALPINTLLEEALDNYHKEKSYPPFDIEESNLAKKLWHEKQMQTILNQMLADLEPYESLLKKQTGYPEKIDIEHAQNVTAILVTYLLEIDERNLLFHRPLIRFFVEQGYFEVTEKMFVLAKEMDPLLTHKDLFQAMRHIWIMNSLQIFWEKPMELTSSIYSFGMLYPYEDNFLDNPEIEAKEKAALNQKLSKVLNGEKLAPSNVLEEKITTFFELLESKQFIKETNKIYESVRLIHDAQMKSMDQTSDDSMSKDELLSIAFLKGGSTVLADGLLVKGDLTTEEMHFAFQIGCFLQLIDDLQDIKSDTDDEIQTIFNSKENQHEVDEEVKRLISFVFEVSKKKESDTSDQAMQKEVFRYSMLVLVMDAIGQQPEVVSPAFYKEMEKNSNVRLSFYKKLWEEIAKIMGV